MISETLIPMAVVAEVSEQGGLDTALLLDLCLEQASLAHVLEYQSLAFLPVTLLALRRVCFVGLSDLGVLAGQPRP